MALSTTWSLPSNAIHVWQVSSKHTPRHDADDRRVTQMFPEVHWEACAEVLQIALHIGWRNCAHGRTPVGR